MSFLLLDDRGRELATVAHVEEATFAMNHTFDRAERVVRAVDRVLMATKHRFQGESFYASLHGSAARAPREDDDA
ncbi:MAG: hypothetical protein JWP97_5746 [Labilithrix sp.]|nr:hypothetical protein [Labilithrix sp.]